MRFITAIFIVFWFSFNTLAADLNVYGLGMYDVICDGKDDPTLDYRYERRFDNTIFDIGPEEDNFFFLKPFAGFEFTGDSASYFLAGIYLEDNVGQLLSGKENNIVFTPSLGVGYYDNGSGKNLGTDIQFRTTFELSYELKTKNRIAISLGHISNANLGDKNPGVETLSLSYQVPY